MRNRIYFDFMGNRWILFSISAVLIVISIAAIAIRGLTFGIEFKGGTAATFPPKASITEEQIRTAMQDADVPDARNASIQKTASGSFIVRSAESSAVAAQGAFLKAERQLGYTANTVSVQTIGPGWGRNVTNKAVLALILSIAAILLYVSLRFEYKMSVTAVIALVHDVLITLGVYALLGREVTPNTVAALLTILGYSLYDTIVVFHRIKENSQHLAKQTFMQMANDSINQVLVRSINTSLVALIPMLTLFIFGGETLKDFAFALLIGLFSGAYSSVAVASPIYAMWKEREPKYRALAKKFGTSNA